VPAYALLRGQGPVSAAVHMLPLLALVLLARRPTLRRSTRAGAAALGLMTTAALAVQLSGGATEAHFLFFALLPLAALYAARAPFLLAIAFVAGAPLRPRHAAAARGVRAPRRTAADGRPARGVRAPGELGLPGGLAALRRPARARRGAGRRAHRGALRPARRARGPGRRRAVHDDAVVTTTPDGRITSWNPGAERLYGWPAAEVLGRHASLLSAGDALPDDLTTLPSGAMERRQRRRDGSVFDALVTLSMVRGDDGTATGVAAITRDITGRKRAEVQAHATARLLEQQAGELAHRALHDPSPAWPTGR
jgi:PAS domain S-box-containing protein